MAHGFRDLGRESTFVTRKILPWHKLGKVVDAMTSKEAIILGGMDFEVGLAPIFAGVDVLKKEDTPNHSHVLRSDKDFFEASYIQTNFATYRKDTKQVFGVVGSKYEVIQNIEAFDFFDSIIGEGHAKYETVGALGNGEKIFITAKLPSKLIVNKEDIDKYLLFTMAHDGSGSVQVMFTPIRVVCNNTLSAALSGCSNKVNIRHTKNARNRLELSKEILGITERQSTSLEEVFTAFAKYQMNDEDLKALFMKSFNMKEGEDGKLSTKANNTLDDILKYHEIGVGQEGIRGTAWGAYNAITGYQQNVQKYRDASVAFESISNKTAATIRQSAFNSLLQLV